MIRSSSRARFAVIATRVAVIAVVLAAYVSVTGQTTPEAVPTPNHQSSQATHAAPPPGATYVGADTCKTCHEPIVKAGFDLTPHGRLVALGKHGCEDCHGPGSAHVEGGGTRPKSSGSRTLHLRLSATAV